MYPITKTALLTLVMASFLGCITVKHYKKEALTIQSVQVFRDFRCPGPGAYYCIRHHISKEFQIINVDAPDKRHLEQVFRHAKRTPRFGKLPPVAAAGKIKFSNRPDSDSSIIAFLPNTYDSYNIYDITTGVDYIVHDTEDGKWLSAFIEKIRTM